MVSRTSKSIPHGMPLGSRLRGILDAAARGEELPEWVEELRQTKRGQMILDRLGREPRRDR